MSSTKTNIFHFKQFAVDQAGCGMKVNTDGVLLGALAQADSPLSILDIGTGTGVIALMLAQRFPEARVDAVEIEIEAAQTARGNFEASGFSNRLRLFPLSFQQFSDEHPGLKYDLIVSNPPFFINSLKNPDRQKELARHAETMLFEELMQFCEQHLSPQGSCQLILPLDTAASFLKSRKSLYHQKTIEICSYSGKEAHRKILTLGFESTNSKDETFIIYKSEKVYSAEYSNLLKDFLTIF